MRETEGGKQKIKSSSDMLVGDFKKILSFFETVDMCGQISDPIYHPKFHDLLEEFKKQNHCHLLRIHTNGTRKSIEWWEKTFSYKNISWIFGLDGTNQETANIYRVTTRFQEVLNVMILGKKLDVDVYWQFIPFEHNEHQIDTFYKLCDQYGITPILKHSKRWIPERIEKHKIYPPKFLR